MKNKYHARSFVDASGQRFASQAEYRRWCDLELMQAAGVISDLQRQVSLPCLVNGVKVCDYVADAYYIEKDQHVIEDVKGGSGRPGDKGTRTAVYRLKKKLVKACYGIAIRETEG